MSNETLNPGATYQAGNPNLPLDLTIYERYRHRHAGIDTNDFKAPPVKNVQHVKGPISGSWYKNLTCMQKYGLVNAISLETEHLYSFHQPDCWKIS